MPYADKKKSLAARNPLRSAVCKHSVRVLQGVRNESSDFDVRDDGSNND